MAAGILGPPNPTTTTIPVVVTVLRLYLGFLLFKILYAFLQAVIARRRINRPLFWYFQTLVNSAAFFPVCSLRYTLVSLTSQVTSRLISAMPPYFPNSAASVLTVLRNHRT